MTTEREKFLDKQTFLRYFCKTYVIRYTYNIPLVEEAFKHMYTSARTVGDNMLMSLDQYPIDSDTKQNIKKFYDRVDEVWESYLLATTDDLRMGDLVFQKWTFNDKVQNLWREIQALAQNICNSIKNQVGA